MNGKIAIRWLDVRRRSSQTFSTLEGAHAYVEALGKPAQFERDGWILGTWNVVNGLQEKKVYISTRRQEENKKKIFALLGDKCSECPWDDPRALVIDHIDGGGGKEYRGGGGGNGYYVRVLRHLRGTPAGERSKKYQLLCANHNMIKRSVKQEALGRRQHKRQPA